MTARILLVANVFPYPPTHGAAVDIWTRIQTFAKLAIPLDLIATVKTTPGEAAIECVRSSVDTLVIVMRSGGIRSLLSFVPYQVQSRRDLREIPLAGRYDAVILEAEHVAAIRNNPQLSAGLRILRVHNNEAVFFQGLSRAAGTIAEKIFYAAESLKFRMFSPRVIADCDQAWFISDSERQSYVQRHKEAFGRCFFVPPAVERSSCTQVSLIGRTALFVGSLGLASNADAIRWFVGQVHPLLAGTNGYKFVVAGSTAGPSYGGLRPMLQDSPDIYCEEEPAELSPLYARAAVFVNPVRYGAGLKLKTINAIRAGLPVVTTSIGMEGTRLRSGEHVVVADTAQEFAAAVSLLCDNKKLAREMVSRAQEFLLREYDQARIITELLGHTS